jgi:hypothetical protein
MPIPAFAPGVSIGFACGGESVLVDGEVCNEVRLDAVVREA